MTCGLIMTPDPLTAREGESVGEVATRLIRNHYINLPVVDAGGRFLGMFGITDVFALLLPNLRFMGDDAGELRRRFAEAKSRKVGEAADRDVRVVHPDTPEIEALRLFCEQHTTLAVVERESRKLVGILSYWDAMCALTGLGRES